MTHSLSCPVLSAAESKCAHQWCVDEGVGDCGHAPVADVDVCADLQVVKLDQNLGQLHTSPVHQMGGTDRKGQSAHSNCGS
jgi:hypothetical protein